MWAEGSTDGHEVNSRFSQVCERVQKSKFLFAERLAVLRVGVQYTLP
jgi:hypothetical protein